MSQPIDVTDIRGACERTIAFVFAPNEDSGHNLLEVGAALCASGMAAVFLMADTSAAEDAVSAMRQLGRKGRGPLVQAAEFDFSVAYGIDASSVDFQADGLPESLLLVMRSLAESMLDVYEHVVVADASLPAPSREDVVALFGMSESAGSASRTSTLRLIARSELDALD